MTRSFVVLACLMGPVCVAAGDEKDKDPVRVKLFAAKVAYDEQMKQYRMLGGEWLDKSEEVARKDGNKKLVDQLKEERKVFDESGQLPKRAPAAVLQKPALAKKALELAYTQAVKEYLKAKNDDAVAAVEMEFKLFLTAQAGAKLDGRDLYPVGTILTGELKWNGDTGNHNYMIVITERTGKGFRGVARLDYGPSGDPKRKALYDIDGEVTAQGLKYKGEVPGLGLVEGKWEKDVLQISAGAENGGILSGGLRFKKN